MFQTDKILYLLIVLFVVAEVNANNNMYNSYQEQRYKIQEPLLKSLNDSEKKCKKGKRLLMVGGVFSGMAIGLLTYKVIQLKKQPYSNDYGFGNPLIYTTGGSMGGIGIACLTAGTVKLSLCNRKHKQVKHPK